MRSKTKSKMSHSQEHWRFEGQRIVNQLERTEAAPAATPPPPGFTAPPAAPGQLESHKARARLASHLASLQASGAPPPAWLELYDNLLEEKLAGRQSQRWDWRKALYIAWSCVPRSRREPKTLQALADLLGVRPSTIRKWRLHDPDIQRRIADLPRQILLDHVADVYDAMIQVASTPDYHATPERQLFLKVAGLLQTQVELAGRLDLDHTGQVDINHDLSRLSDEQLDQLEAITAALGHPV